MRMVLKLFITPEGEGQEEKHLHLMVFDINFICCAGETTNNKEAECVPATGQQRQPQSQSQAVEPGRYLLSFLAIQESTAHTRVWWFQYRHVKIVEKMFIES